MPGCLFMSLKSGLSQLLGRKGVEQGRLRFVLASDRA